MYTAYYMPDDNRGINKSGFDTEEEAWNYIALFLCPHCRKTLLDGYATYTDGVNEEDLPVRGPWDTGCGAEWLVGLTKDFENAKNIEDVWEAGGYQRIDEPTLENFVKPECSHDWKFEGVKDGNIIWQCSKCPQQFIDGGDGGDG